MGDALDDLLDDMEREPHMEDEETECRLCGEIEPCSGPGLCDSCLNRMRNRVPEARL